MLTRRGLGFALLPFAACTSSTPAVQPAAPVARPLAIEACTTMPMPHEMVVDWEAAAPGDLEVELVSSPDPCRVNVDLACLTARERGLVTRRVLACTDHAHGRISDDEYKVQVAAIDAAWTVMPPPAPPQTLWATTVRDVSTQYGTSSWSANQVLGAPNVFPNGGDYANAWAPLGADDRNEWIEVGYAEAAHASAVEVYETYNPGAVSSIELVTASGVRVTAYQGAPAATGLAANKLRVELGCTSEPIVAVRVHLASPQVAGWNELDAIGLVLCTQP